MRAFFWTSVRRSGAFSPGHGLQVVGVRLNGGYYLVNNTFPDCKRNLTKLVGKMHRDGNSPLLLGRSATLVLATPPPRHTNRMKFDIRGIRGTLFPVFSALYQTNPMTKTLLTQNNWLQLTH